MMIHLLPAAILKQPKKMIKPFMIGLTMFYMVFHALHGKRGLYALVKEQQKREVVSAELDAVRGELAAVENRIHRFQTGSVDLDLLDEQLRRHMGIAPDDEYLVLMNVR
jgi:cell division protein FtsB